MASELLPLPVPAAQTGSLPEPAPPPPPTFPPLSLSLSHPTYAQCDNVPDEIGTPQKQKNPVTSRSLSWNFCGYPSHENKDLVFFFFFHAVANSKA